jgi:hypothetical protein
VLNDVTTANGILADPVEDFGPCLNDEGETDAPVRYPGRPCNLCPHLRVRPATYPANWTLCRSGVCARSLVRRTYIRTATGVIRGGRTPELFSRCGRAGKGDGTGYWDVAQIHARIEQVSRQVTKPEPSPSRVPMISACFPRGSIRGDGDA